MCSNVFFIWKLFSFYYEFIICFAFTLNHVYNTFVLKLHKYFFPKYNVLISIYAKVYRVHHIDYGALLSNLSLDNLFNKVCLKLDY